MNTHQRFQALVETAGELEGLYTELTEITKAKRSAYHSAFLASTESSFTARDGFARANAHDLDQDELDLKCQVQILEMRKELLEFLIRHDAPELEEPR